MNKFYGKNVLVTGGNGMIGKSLVKLLLNQSANVTVADMNISEELVSMKTPKRVFNGVCYRKLDLRNFNICQDVCKEMDYVFHLAGVKGSPKMCKEKPASFMVPMLQFNTNMMESARIANVKWYLFTSSVGVYSLAEVFREDDVWSTFPSSNDRFAGWAKRMGELQAEAYSIQYNWNKVSIVRPANCFSEDTEVLTPNGIRNIKDFKIGDKVYTLNPNTHEVEIDDVINTISKPINEIINIKTRSLDWRITPDHNLYVSKKRNFKLISANMLFKENNRGAQRILAKHLNIKDGINSEFFNMWEWIDENHFIGLKTKEKYKNTDLSSYNFKIVNGKEKHYMAKKKDIINIDLFSKKYKVFVKDFNKNSKYNPIFIKMLPFIKLLAWYITEGNISNEHSAQIVISQNPIKNKDNYEEIYKTIKDAGFFPSKGIKNISFTSRVFRNFLVNNGLIGSYNKYIPNFIFELNYNLRKIFFDTLMKGDGDKNKYRYTTSSKRLMNDFFRLSFTLGMIPNYKCGNNINRIMIRKSQQRTFKQQHLKYENTKETVYCITAKKNHIIFAGRNGYFNWIGQCYGQYDNFDTENAMVIPSLIRKAYENDVLEVWGDGSPIRDFIHSDDVARGMLFVVENKITEPINLGSGTGVTIKTIAEIVAKEFGRKIKWLINASAGDKKRLFDMTRANSYGFKPEISIERGIKDTIKWFLENKDIIDKRYNVFKEEK